MQSFIKRSHSQFSAHFQLQIFLAIVVSTPVIAFGQPSLRLASDTGRPRAIDLSPNRATSNSSHEKSIAITPLEEEIYHDKWIDLNKNGKKDPYEDSSLPDQKRVDNLLSLMTVEEKTCQLATIYGYNRILKQDLPNESWKQEIWKDGIANIDEHINGIATWEGKEEGEYIWPPSNHTRAINEVQKWFVEETRLGIPVDFTNEGIRGICHQKATNMPAQSAIGCSWDRDLIYRIGRATGSEAKALGYTNIYSPILDLSRDPRWGRVVECYGEDPYHVSQLGLQQIQGLMDEGVASTCKHYAVYSVPKGARDGDARTNPSVSRREMEMMYLRPFEVAVREGKIQGVMSSYNDYDAIPVSGSKEMLTDILRKRMGFEGYVVSDSDAVRFIYSKHHVVENYKQATGRFLEAGGNVRTTFSSPQAFINPVRELISEGKLSMEIIDDRVRDVLRVKMELGLFDNPYNRYPSRANKIVHSDEHQALALEAAQKSIVLLKNDNDLLPLDKSIGSVLVCGPNAKAVFRSRYGPTGGECVSILDAVKDAVSSETEVFYEKGCELVDGRWPESEILPEDPNQHEASVISNAVKKAKEVDVVIAVMGGSGRTVGESTSRTDLNLPGHQKALLKALHATGKPVVLVLCNGRALSINWADRNVPSIVNAWFGGEAAGTAVADVLFGDVNPSGKLPITFPRTVGQLPYNFPYKPGSQAAQGKQSLETGVGRSRIVGALYPFGYGLSYTNYEYSQLKINNKSIKTGEPVVVSCRITNTGEVAGEEIVQVYLRDTTSSVITYEKTLCGFDRVSLKPGESKEVTFEIAPTSMELLDENMVRTIELGQFEVFVGSSSEDIRLAGSYSVEE